ncbi:hypothetical protein pb186bvf_008797 [Paramecium bursaria]
MIALAGQKLKTLSEHYQEAQPQILHLDLSGNFLKSGSELGLFPNLQTLIIDNNYFFNLNDFPVLPNLKTFSANKNNFNNLEIFIQECQKKFPNLIHLSLIKNPLCPMLAGEEGEYQRYRTEIIRNIKTLQNLDGVNVDPREANPNYFKKIYFQLSQSNKRQTKKAPLNIIKNIKNQEVKQQNKEVKEIDLQRTINYDIKINFFCYCEVFKFLIRNFYYSSKGSTNTYSILFTCESGYNKVDARTRK